MSKCRFRWLIAQKEIPIIQFESKSVSGTDFAGGVAVDTQRNAVTPDPNCLFRCISLRFKVTPAGKRPSWAPILTTEGSKIKRHQRPPKALYGLPSCSTLV
jgi:hypothetical protein